MSQAFSLQAAWRLNSLPAFSTSHALKDIQPATSNRTIPSMSQPLLTVPYNLMVLSHREDNSERDFFTQGPEVQKAERYVLILCTQNI